jgi:hypothetical protein
MNRDLADRYAQALDTLHWSARSIAPWLKCGSRTCQSWLTIGPPKGVVEWLERMVDIMRQNPPPQIRIQRPKGKKDE